MRASNISSSLASLWLSKVDYELKEEIILPALLQEIGKFILSDLLISEDKTELFKSKIASGCTIEEVERELLGFTTSEITSKIFGYWKLSENLINMIEFVDNIQNVNPEYKKKAQILDVIKTACQVSAPLSDANVQKAINKASKYGLDTKVLEKAIVTLQDRLLDE
jgi:HD-like signal output (HDOD) protein